MKKRDKKNHDRSLIEIVHLIQRLHIFCLARIKDIDFDLDEEDDVRRMESKEVWNTKSNYTVVNPIMFKLTRKIELATGFNVSDKYSSTPYQVN